VDQIYHKAHIGLSCYSLAGSTLLSKVGIVKICIFILRIFLAYGF
jgi:hypothetical protein